MERKQRCYSLSTAVSLCQLYRSTQYFIKDLTSWANFYLRRCGDIAFLQTDSSPRENFSIKQAGLVTLLGNEPGVDCKGLGKPQLQQMCKNDDVSIAVAEDTKGVIIEKIQEYDRANGIGG